MEGKVLDVKLRLIHVTLPWQYTVWLGGYFGMCCQKSHWTLANCWLIVVTTLLVGSHVQVFRSGSFLVVLEILWVLFVDTEKHCSVQKASK